MVKRTIIPLLVILFLVTGCITDDLGAGESTRPPSVTDTPRVNSPAAEYTPTPEKEIDTPDWFDETILFEIFVRSFFDADGDGIGDLQGVIDNLDYLESMGVNAIWLMPIHPSPSYHGYDVTDYFAVNPDYGTLEDMQALIDATHQREMRVIIDYVVNHMSNQHPIFLDAYGDPGSEYADWFVWLNDEHTDYQAFGGFKHMPELNYDNPEVYEFILQIARFWIDPNNDGDPGDGVDGFRADVAKGVPLETWQALRKEIRTLNPEFLLLGEVWESNAQKLVRWYEDAFDALFDYPLYHTIAANQDVNMDSALLGQASTGMFSAVILGEDALFPPGYQIVRFVNNHDNNRVMSEVGMDLQLARAAAAFYMMLPGTPMIYYGEEIGMPGEKGSGPYWDEYRREPMDWYSAEEGPGMTNWFRPPDRFNAPDDGISVQEQQDGEDSLLTYYRDLTTLRNNHPALRHGAFAKVNTGDAENVYAYTRHAPPIDGQPEEWFLIMLNFGDQAQSLNLELLTAYQGPFETVDALSGERGPDISTGGAFGVDLPGSSAVILQLTVP
jgi:glycosidase